METFSALEQLSLRTFPMTTETTDFADFTEIFSFCRSFMPLVLLLHFMFCFVFFFSLPPLSQLSSLGRCFCC